MVATALELLGFDIGDLRSLTAENQQLRRELSEATDLLAAIREKVMEAAEIERQAAQNST